MLATFVMGYSIHQRSTAIHIDVKDVAKALAAVKALHGRETCGCVGAMHFAFVRPDFLQATSLGEALGEWRWDVGDLAPDGSVVSLNFLGESHGDEDMLFAALAPYVRSGSHIEMVGENGAVWRWVFQDENLYVVPAVVTFPSVYAVHRINANGPFDWLRFRGEAK